MDVFRCPIYPVEDGGNLYRVYFISDLHFGTVEFNHKAWQKFILEYIDNPGYVIFAGDLAEFILHTDPRFDFSLLSTKDFKKFQDIKEYAYTILNILKGKLEIFKNYILLFVGGNHEQRFLDATTISPLRFLSETFGVPYSFYRAYVALQLMDNGTDPPKHRSLVTCMIHHGSGGGRRRGADINRVEEMAMWGAAEIYFMGHSHKPIASPGVHYRYTGKRFQKVPVLYLRGGSFRTGADDEHPEPLDYTIRSGWQPLPASCIRVNIRVSKLHHTFTLHPEVLSWT